MARVAESGWGCFHEDGSFSISFHSYIEQILASVSAMGVCISGRVKTLNPMQFTMSIDQSVQLH